MNSSYDIVVIGAGAAGLSAAGYAARAGYSTLALDAAAPGGQLLFIDTIENYPGRESISGFALAEEMEKQALSFGVEIEYSEVSSVSKKDDGFNCRWRGKVKSRDSCNGRKAQASRCSGRK